MATRTKAWFFDTPQSTSYKRFSKNNKPSQSTFYDLLDSICLKAETGDTASETQQGIAKLCTDTNAKARTSAAATAIQTLVRPHQLPMMQLGDATEIASGVANADEGLKLTGINKTAGAFTRLNYQIELDAESLSAVTAVATDYIVIEDVTDNSTKKALISDLTSIAAGYWSLSSTDLSPSSDTYDLKLLKDLYFDGISDAIIYVDDHATADGKYLKIKAGNAGGAANDGGDIYLYPGIKTGAGADGDTFIGYNGSTAIGFVGIRGVVGSGSYHTKITGGVETTGAVKLGASSAAAATQAMAGDATGVLKYLTPKLFMDMVVSATLAADAVPYFDGASWTSAANAGAKLQYITGLTSDAQTQINTKITAAAAAIVNADVHASAGILGSKINVGSASKIAITTAGSVLTYADTATYPSLTELTYVKGGTSPFQDQIDDVLETSGGLGSAYKTGNFNALLSEASHYICNTTANDITASLPDTTTVPDGTTFSFTMKYSGGAFDLTLATLGGGDVISINDLSEPASVKILDQVAGDATGSSVTVVKRADGHWDVTRVVSL